MSSTSSPRRARFVFACCLGAVLAIVPTAASAQELDEPGSYTWHRRQPHGYQSPQSMALELRFGPYRPKIDDEFGVSPGPYENVFGDSARLYFGIELDYQALRIPYVGTIGPGFSWGYTRMKAKAKLTGTNTDSAEDTSLWIMPMYVVGVLRVDVLARETVVPLVPYLKLGAGYAWWRASDGSGRSDYGAGDNVVEGKGHSYGLHFAPGIMLELDPFDRHAAKQLDNSVGINHSYLYLEWMYSKLDGFGSGGQMQVGTSTWVAGLALEF
jgi:hypothetical protein